MFECNCCGCCCRNLSKSKLYADLDRGDGTCKYLTDNLCSIYEERPLLCRVDKCYELFFKDSISIAEYYKLNMDMCKKLKDTEG